MKSELSEALRQMSVTLDKRRKQLTDNSFESKYKQGDHGRLHVFLLSDLSQALEDAIKSLEIQEATCWWTCAGFQQTGYCYYTNCGNKIYPDVTVDYKYCPSCGRKIEYGKGEE